MNVLVHGAAVMLAVAAATSPTVSSAQDQNALVSERDKNSYMVGMDVGRSIKPAGPDIDFAAFERAVRNTFAGHAPLLKDAEVQPLAQALVERIKSRAGQTTPGATVPTVSKEKVGYLVGGDVGRSLSPIQDELELATFVRGVRVVIEDGKPLLSEAEAQALGQAFGQKVQSKFQQKAEAVGQKNAAEGAEFLAKNKTVKGVFTTPSGLQYAVLRQGAGARPKPSDKVRVNYQGTLIDGTEFDSSYKRGEPAEFPLSGVIQGWTEGLMLMPVGSKYRFWIPAEIGYGARGAPGGAIGPNATLIFDVELMGILQQ